jgi:hypothetical protein
MRMNLTQQFRFELSSDDIQRKAAERQKAKTTLSKQDRAVLALGHFIHAEIERRKKEREQQQ